MNALAPTLDLAPALVVLPGPKAAASDGEGVREIRPPQARDLFERGPVLLAHAAMTARRLGMHAPARSVRMFDALELFAFVRPARFAAPSAAGLALALGLPEPKGAAAQAGVLQEVCAILLKELAEAPWPTREDALATAETLARGGWAWGPAVVGALRSQPLRREVRGSGMDVWSRIPEWEDAAPPGEPGTKPIEAEDAAERLKLLLQRSGLDEARPMQAVFAAETAYAFQP
ncbi:MAG TPA: ATP-dependent DNA helicase, partial [Caulobacteraceae bacterium]